MIHRDEPGRAEPQHRGRVSRPAHFVARIDAAKAIGQPLDGRSTASSKVRRPS